MWSRTSLAVRQLVTVRCQRRCGGPAGLDMSLLLKEAAVSQIMYHREDMEDRLSQLYTYKSSVAQ